MATFNLKEDAKSKPMSPGEYTNMSTYMYERCPPVYRNMGRVVLMTEPETGHVISPHMENGFMGTISRAYNEHRHLVLRPDDIWLTITIALSIYISKHAEKMRHKFVDHEGKMKLEAVGGGTLYTADWQMMISQMSDLIENNTKGEIGSWMEPNFSTTTPKMKTVGRVVLMGAMKHYFDYKMSLTCGIPRITLLGTLEDWKELRSRARHLKSFDERSLSHWADLLDPVLAQFIEAYSGNVDKEFWSHIYQKANEWGSGPVYLTGWANVFVPFREVDGESILSEANPHRNGWGTLAMDEIPPSTVEVPVKIDDNGREYDTIFYGGHIVCVYNEDEDSVQPSLDWAIVDITEGLKTKEQDKQNGQDVDSYMYKDKMKQNYKLKWREFHQPMKFHYGAYLADEYTNEIGNITFVSRATTVSKWYISLVICLCMTVVITFF